MAFAMSDGRGAGWIAKSRPQRPVIGASWSVNDVIMVAAWLMVLPHAAATFQHDILVPPFSGVSAATTFFVASAAALIELLIAAVLARVFGSISRKALQHLICRSRNLLAERWAAAK